MISLLLLLPQYMLKQNVISQLADLFHFLAFFCLGLCKKNILNIVSVHMSILKGHVKQEIERHVTCGINYSRKPFPWTIIFELSVLSSVRTFIWIGAF